MNWQQIADGDLDYNATAFVAIASPYLYLVIDSTYGGNHWKTVCYSLRELAYDLELEFDPLAESPTADVAKSVAETHYDAHEQMMED